MPSGILAPVISPHADTIDEQTKVEIICDTPQTTIYYTTDGSKPEPFNKSNARTHVYKPARGLYLTQGQSRCVKAIAAPSSAASTAMPSVVVTRYFTVKPKGEVRVEQHARGTLTETKRVKPRAESPPRTGTEVWREKAPRTTLQRGSTSRSSASSGSSSASGSEDEDEGTRGRGWGRSKAASAWGQEDEEEEEQRHRERSAKKSSSKRGKSRSDDNRCSVCNALPASRTQQFCHICGSELPQTLRASAVREEVTATVDYSQQQQPSPYRPQQTLQHTAPYPHPQPPFNPAYTQPLPPPQPQYPFQPQQQPQQQQQQQQQQYYPPQQQPQPQPQGYYPQPPVLPAQPQQPYYSPFSATQPQPLPPPPSQAPPAPYYPAAAPLPSPYATHVDTMTTTARAVDAHMIGTLAGTAPYTPSEYEPSLSVTSSVKRPSRHAHVGTQTTGLFSTGKHAKDEKSDKDKADKDKERESKVGDISPGQGYWRAQLDHVAYHLKQYTRDNPIFQAAIGQPIMGSVRESRIEDEDDAIVVTIILAKKDKETLKGEADERRRRRERDQEAERERREEEAERERQEKQMSIKLKQLSLQKAKLEQAKRTLSATPSRGDDERRSEDRREDRRERDGTKEDKPKKKLEVSMPTKALHAEVSDKGEGKPDVVLGLVDEGADVNSLSSANNGKVACYPLYLATVNGHVGCIPVLIDAGADVNAVSKNGETALHGAVRAAKGSMEMIEQLLNAKADPEATNRDGATPCALATALNKPAVAKFFAAKLGKGMLAKLTKSGL